MKLQLDIFAIRNISQWKAKKKKKKIHTVVNVEQNSNVKVIQQHRIHIIYNRRETCYSNTNKSDNMKEN